VMAGIGLGERLRETGAGWVAVGEKRCTGLFGLGRRQPCQIGASQNFGELFARPRFASDAKENLN
jgi:hypothetical protein